MSGCEGCSTDVRRTWFRPPSEARLRDRSRDGAGREDVDAH